MMHRTREPGRWDEVKIALRESSIPPQPQFPVPSFGNRWTSLSLPGWDNICKLADNHNDSDNDDTSNVYEHDNANTNGDDIVNSDNDSNNTNDVFQESVVAPKVSKHM